MVFELLALLSAVSFAVGNVIARMSLRGHGSPFSSTVMFAASATVMWFIVLATGTAVPALSALPLFLFRGVLDPGLAALFIFLAFRGIGASVTVPIIAASALVVTALSVVFLGEAVTAAIAAGTVLIVAGVFLLSFNHGGIKGKRRYIWYAVIGSLLIGTANVVTKAGLNAFDAPVSGVAVAFTAGLAVHALLLVALGKWRELPLAWNASRGFLLAGVFISAAFALSFFALSEGTVSVAYPLINIQPLFVLIISWLFLRRYEFITRNIVLGTILTVAGASLLVL